MGLFSRSGKKRLIMLFAAVILIVRYFFNGNISQNRPVQISTAPVPTLTSSIDSFQTARVSRVIDGDTIELESGQKVRYIGINTPELHDPRKPVECFAREAYAENQRLVEGKTVRLEKDVSDVDRYKRLLRFVYVDNRFINDYLVRQGFAQIDTFPPDVRFASQFLEAQNEARINNRGLWSSCSLVRISGQK